MLVSEGEVLIAGQSLEIPYAWTDGNVYLHIENAGRPYRLTLNGEEVALCADPVTPAEYALTPYIREGENSLLLELDNTGRSAINPEATPREPFAGSYLYMQNKRSIRDFTISLEPDPEGRDFGVLRLDIVAQNSYNYDEPVTVGYDIYSPQGKLLEFNMTEVTIPGRSTDTVRFDPYIYGTFANKWEGGAKSVPLYKVMLFTRRDGVYKEYMPMKIGFGKTELRDGKLMRLGKELTLKRVRCNAGTDPTATRRELLRLKVGGTPSNDPRLADEYLERVKAMYYRSRNFTCVVAFALGAPSGNGYNMYKAYEWLKSVEKSRPVIYEDADGEWNSDL